MLSLSLLQLNAAELELEDETEDDVPVDDDDDDADHEHVADRAILRELEENTETGELEAARAATPVAAHASEESTVAGVTPTLASAGEAQKSLAAAGNSDSAADTAADGAAVHMISKQAHAGAIIAHEIDAGELEILATGSVEVEGEGDSSPGVEPAVPDAASAACSADSGLEESMAQLQLDDGTTAVPDTSAAGDERTADGALHGHPEETTAPAPATGSAPPTIIAPLRKHQRPPKGPVRPTGAVGAAGAAAGACGRPSMISAMKAKQKADKDAFRHKAELIAAEARRVETEARAVAEAAAEDRRRQEEAAAAAAAAAKAREQLEKGRYAVAMATLAGIDLATSCELPHVGSSTNAGARAVAPLKQAMQLLLEETVPMAPTGVRYSLSLVVPHTNLPVLMTRAAAAQAAAM